MQDFLVYLLVACATLYLLRRAFVRLKSGTGGNCPGCKGCGTAKNKPQPLIQLERRQAPRL
ncbi:FeoB-associated Cys-rich membrane protein [Armatimonas sp.]|uniref:FeoB-associated Cys-rich membrane protein n=1 Tax=Armatimonas sp. TaxID=1872638 RepID=UPI00286CB266|nr:FeoB-associated Cys-rich membrane protein [Armatimonas sp.]